VSRDKNWIVTADSGSDNILVVWDAEKAAPVKTIFQPHPNGVEVMDLSDDNTGLVTLSKSVPGLYFISQIANSRADEMKIFANNNNE
jgi:WD40 repeat protein